MPTRLARTLTFPAVLLALNIYFSSDLFRLEYSAWMDSIESAYISLSRYIIQNWRDLTWFPLWYGGIPFQNAYPPLLHFVVAGFSSAAGLSVARAHHIVTASFYCLGPLTLYALALRLTGSRWYSFWAGLAYAIVSPSEFLIPSARDFGTVWSLRRFDVLVRYGEGPHITAMTFLPLAILCLDVALCKRKAVYYVLAALSMDAVVLSNWLGAFALALAIVAYLLARPSSRSWVTSGCIGLLAYAFACPWIPPSTIRDIRYNAQFVEGDFRSAYQILPYAAATALLVLLILKLAFRKWRWPPDVQFSLLFALLMVGITLSHKWFGIALIPQPARYHLEMDLALCLAGALVARPLFDRSSTAQKAAVVCALLTVCSFPVRRDRRYARRIVRPIHIEQTIEYQTAKWFDSHLTGQRVLVAGTLSFWLNAFTDTPQFGGGFDQGIVNRTQPHVAYQIYNSTGATEAAGEISVLWLRAFGLSAIQVGGPNSRQQYKLFKSPERFQPLLMEGVRDGDDVVYLVPPPAGLAHLVPADAVVRTPPANGIDIDQTRRYVAALGDAGMPPASLRWTNRHSAEILAEVRPGTALSVQETYHPGWYALANGVPAKVSPDGLGQIVIAPPCIGQCRVQLVFDGGLEAHVARWISWLSLSACALWVIFENLPKNRSSRS